MKEETNGIKYFDGVFEVEDRKSGNEFLYETIIGVDDSLSPDNFEMRFLYNRNEGISENSIYKFYTDKQRIGWVFPVQSLESKEHDYVDDEYYLQYAYIAIYKLLQMIEFAEEEYSDFSILDYYSDDIQVLVYDKERADSTIENFDIYNYSVDLFSKGYSFCKEGNVFTKSAEIDKNIRVKQLPEPIRGISYINILFIELIPLQESSYSKFHLIYQIIEILIGVVFKYKMESLIQEIAASPEDLFEKREKLNDVMTEKKRVIWLFSNFSKIESQKKEILNDFCKQLLEKNHKVYEEHSVGSNLYAVRCLIVHNFYSLNKQSRKLLEELNVSFLDVVLDILFTFTVAEK